MLHKIWPVYWPVRGGFRQIDGWVIAGDYLEASSGSSFVPPEKENILVMEYWFHISE